MVDWVVINCREEVLAYVEHGICSDGQNLNTLPESKDDAPFIVIYLQQF
jgi:hypothetical protein